MTLPDWLTFENVRNCAVILASTIAALTYVNGKRQEAVLRRSKDVEFWVRTIVHSLFQRSNDKHINFDTIVSQARNDAIAFKKYRVNADELSAEYIRRVVVSMVSDEIISQLGGDNYCLHTPSSTAEEMNSVMSRQTGSMMDFFNNFNQERRAGSELAEKLNDLMMSVTTKMVTESEIRDEVLRQVTDDPFRYSRTDLILRVVQATGATNESVKAKTADMIVSKQLSRDNAGRVGPAGLDGPEIIDLGKRLEDRSGNV